MQYVPQSYAEAKYLNSVAVHLQMEVIHFNLELALPFSMLF